MSNRSCSHMIIHPQHCFILRKSREGLGTYCGICIERGDTSRLLSSGCPVCNYSKADAGKTDLETCYPEIASEFNPELNNGKKPSDYLPNSGELINWACPKNHVWPCTIRDRVQRGRVCPYCNNLKADVGRTDLETCYPTIAAEFKPELNNGKKPSAYLPNSSERINWICPQGHIWPASIRSRTQNGVTCPKCKGIRKAVRKTI